MNSWEVFGHYWAVEMLQQHVANTNLRHAYLLTGPQGVGRRTLAIRLAQSLNCGTPPEPGVPCRICRSCKQIEAGQHVDLLVIKKLVDKKEISVDQIREVGKFLSLKPYMSAYKVVLITNFEESTLNAQNALLKTLEEAPGFAILLLTAENAEQLLPTVVSRCEILRLRPLKVDVVSGFLVSRGIPGDLANLCAHLSGGRPGYALNLSSDAQALAFRVEKLDEMKALLADRLHARIHYAEKLVKEKEKFRQTLFIWLSFWRDVLLKTSGADVALTNIDRAEEIENLSFEINLSTVRTITTAMENAIDLLEKNVNPRLIAEVTLMDWPRVK